MAAGRITTLDLWEPRLAMKRIAQYRPPANSTVAAHGLAAGAGRQGGQDSDVDGRLEQANGAVGVDGVGPGGMKGIELGSVGAVDGAGAAAGDAAVRGRAAHGERPMAVGPAAPPDVTVRHGAAGVPELRPACVIQFSVIRLRSIHNARTNLIGFKSGFPSVLFSRKTVTFHWQTG